MASLWQPAPYNSTTTSRRPSGLVCQQSRHGAPQALAPGPRQHRAPLRREVLPAATAGGRGGEGKQPQQQQQMGSPPPGVAALQAEPVAQPAAGRVLRVGSRAAPPTAEAAMLAAADPVMGEAVEPAPSTAPPAEMPPPAQQQQQQEQPGGPTLGLDSKVVGMICLLGVAMLKGSYNSMLRLLYAQDGPPGPVAIMLFRGVLQSIVLVAAYLLVAQVTKVKDSEAAAGGDTIAAAEGAAVGMPPPAELPGTASDGSSLVPAWAQRISSRLPYTAIAASELGLWLFLATAIQVCGGDLLPVPASSPCQAAADNNVLMSNCSHWVWSREGVLLPLGTFGCSLPPAAGICAATDARAAADHRHTRRLPHPVHCAAYASAGQLHRGEAQPQRVGGMPRGAGGLPVYCIRRLGHRCHRHAALQPG